MNLKDKLIPMLGEDWFNVLSEYLNSKSFLDIGRFVAKERKTKTVFPSSDKIFRCFKETPYNKVKVVLLGMDPYHDGTANGLAFCCADSMSNNPSMRFILQEIDNCYPENKDSLEHGRMDRGDFQRLAKQGVLLLNRALTVVQKKPGSHMKKWIPFTDEVIKKLNDKGDIIFILLGKDAQTIEPLLTGSSYVIKAPHPAAEIYKPGIGFLGSNVFKQCNEHLRAINKTEINW